MISRSQNELICDFAEEYHIYDFRNLPARTAAILAAGLRGDSRTKLKMSGLKYPVYVYLLAGIFDRLGTSEHSVLSKLLDIQKPDEIMAVSSPEEWQEEWKRRTERGTEDGD